MKKLALSCLILAVMGTAHADIIGAKASVDYWDYNTNTSQATGNNINLEDDYGLAFEVSVEHPVPLIPNAKIKHLNLKTDGKSNFTNTANYNFDLDYSDFILYYEILDTIVSVDVGLGAKVLDGQLKQNHLVANSVSETLPLAYVQAGLKLPFTGLSAKAEANYAKNSDHVVTDAQAEVKYNFIDNMLLDIGLKAGYRILDIKFDEGSANETQFEFKGPYLGLEVHF